MLDVTARALMTCRGKTTISYTTINKVKALDEEAANVLARINAAVERINTKVGPKAGCRRGRTAIRKRMLRLANMTLDQKCVFLKTCEYVSLSCDESDTFSFSAPLAASLQACSPDFLWANLFIGQTDVALSKTGEACYKALRICFTGFM